MKKLLGLLALAMIMIALTTETYIDTGKMPEGSQIAMQVQNIQMPEGVAVTSNEVANMEKSVVEVNTAESNSLTTVALPKIGCAEKVNLSSITKTENYESDVANISVVDTNQAVNEKTGVSLLNATNSMEKDLVMAGRISPLITVASMSTTTGISVNMVSDNFSGKFQKG